MGTLQCVIRTCSGAIWEMSQGQEVIKVRFIGDCIHKVKDFSCIYCSLATCLSSTNHDNDTTEGELLFDIHQNETVVNEISVL